MAMRKVSVTLDAGLVAEIKSQVGERGFSAYLNETLSRQRQRERLAELLRELTEEFGPVPDEVKEQVRKEWDELKRPTSGTG
jgi:hypothetical protein